MTLLPAIFANMPAPGPIGAQPLTMPDAVEIMYEFAQLLLPCDAVAHEMPTRIAAVAATAEPDLEQPEETPDAVLSSIMSGLPPILAAFVAAPIENEVTAKPVAIETRQVTPPELPLASQVKIEQAPSLAQMQALVPKSTDRAQQNEAEAAISELSPPKADPAGAAPTAAPAPAGQATRTEVIIPSTPAQFELRQIDLARDTMWLDDLAKDIVASAQSEDRLSFRLCPREFGRLDVNLSTSDAGLSVRMSTSTEDARAILAAHQPRLVEELRGQGIRVAGAEVHTGDHRQPERNSRETVPFIEVALADEQTNSTPSETRPTGRFA